MAASIPSAQVVGNAFVQQYYQILLQYPGLVYRFYKDISKIGRPEVDGSLSITTTMDAIDAKIQSFSRGNSPSEINSVEVQISENSGINILVTGCFTANDIQKNFAQSFFLAPQHEGYFVLNDMFRYINNNGNHHTEDVVAPAASEQGFLLNNIQYILHRLACTFNIKESRAPNIVPEVADQVQDLSQKAKAFVKQYYHTLDMSPWLVHQFYQDISAGHPKEGASLSTGSSMDVINAKMRSFNYVEVRSKIGSVDVQESLNGGVNVLVMGYLTGKETKNDIRKDNILEYFTQLFFLTPNSTGYNGYLILNDMYIYMNKAKYHTT